MGKTLEDLVVQAEPKEWLVNFQANIDLLLDVWQRTGRMMEELAYRIGKTRATLYNWRKGTYPPDMDGHMAIKEWLGLDFTEPHTEDEIATALVSALSSDKGLYRWMELSNAS